MGYKVQFEDGHEVEFDTQPTQADIDEAHKFVSQKQSAESASKAFQKMGDFAQKIPGYAKEGVEALGGGLVDMLGLSKVPGYIPQSPTGETAKGAAEVATTLGTGSVAAAVAPVPAGLKFANDLASGRDTHFREDYPKMMEQMTYQPKTEAGREMNAPVAEAVNQLGLPMLGIAHTLPISNAPARMPEFKSKSKGKAKGLDAKALIEKKVAEESIPTPADRPQALPDSIPITPEGQGVLSPQDAMYKAEAERKAALVQAARPVPGRDMADPFGQMKQQLDTPQSIPQESPVMAALAKSLQEQPMTAAEMERAGGADKAIAARQAALEQSVARQGNLDFNAAERARQEQAPVLPEHASDMAGDRAMGATAEGLMSPAERMQRQLKREQVPTEGTEVLHTDPAGQTFRGDPADPMAVLGLERQKEAARNNLEHGIATKRGQPMDLLTKDSLKASNEGPHPLSAEDLMQRQFKQELIENTVNEHPFVKKAQEKVTKQEELITKLSEQVQNGRAQQAQLARAIKDLEHLETLAEKTRTNVLKGVSEGQKPAPFDFKRNGKQTGAVNSALFDDMYQATKKVGEYTLELLGRPQGPEVRIYDKAGNDVGGLSSTAVYKGGEQNLTTSFVKVMSDHRRKGLAQEAYKFLAEQGNDIQKSSTLLADGKQLWNHFEQTGFSKNGVIPKINTKGIHPNLAVLGMDAKTVELFNKYIQAKKRPYVTDDPYLATTGNKAAYTRAFNQLYRDLQEKTDNAGVALQQLQRVLDYEGPEALTTIPRGPRSKQGGWIQLPGRKSQEAKVLNDMPHLKLPTIVPEKLTAAEVIDQAKSLPDLDRSRVGKLIDQFTKGAIYEALKTNNPVVKFFNERFTEADRLSRGDVEQYVHQQLGPVTRALNGREKAQIWEAISGADLHQLKLTEADLRASGANDRQIAYWKTHQEVMDKAFESINRARKAAGLEPVNKRISYAAMRSSGDYRKLVYKIGEDGEKHIVGIVGSDFRDLLNRRVKALEAKGFTKENGYEIGGEKYFGGVPKQIGSAQQAFAHTLEALAEKDPRIKEFLTVMDEITKNEAYSYLNMKKHTLQKKGVFGMEGRKDWKTAEQNAHEGMQAQLDYAESALKWGRLSEAVEAVKPVLSDENVKMPNAKEWAEGYMQNALGYNPTKTGHLLETAAAEFMRPSGVGYSNIKGGLAMARKTVNTLLLSLDPGFWLTNVVQPMRAMPGMKAYLEAKGLNTGFDFGTGWSSLSKAAIIEAKARTGGKLSAVEQGAYDYAKTNHVYGSDLVEHSNRASKDAGYYVDKVGNAVASQVEAATRQMMFFAFTDMLHKNGLKVEKGLYEAAHNLTDITMNNYSRQERPNIYNHAGPLGDVSANLSSFKHNEISRVNLLARQLWEEKSARPIVAEIAASVAFAGLRGTLAFEEADWLYRQITKMMGKPDSLTLRAIKLSEDAGKAMGFKKDSNANYALSHGGFSLLGLDMSKRLGMGNAMGDTAADIGFPGVTKLGSIASAAGTAAISPTEMNAKRLAHEVVPRPAATNMDLEWFSKENGNLPLNRDTMEAQAARRTPGDKMAKRFGFTGIHESVSKDKLYQEKAITQAYTDKRTSALNKAKDEIFLTGKPSPESIQAYLDAQGDVKSLVADISRISSKMNIPAKDRELLRSSMSQSITSLQHAKRLNELYNK